MEDSICYEWYKIIHPNLHYRQNALLTFVISIRQSKPLTLEILQ